MTLNLSMPNAPFELKPQDHRGRCRRRRRQRRQQHDQQNLEGVDFIVANTDAQALAQSLCQRRIQLGQSLTPGSAPGRGPTSAAPPPRRRWTRSSASSRAPTWCSSPPAWAAARAPAPGPVIAAAAREQGILTVGVVTKPFHFEGLHRMRIAEAGIQETAAVRRYADHHPQPEPVPHRQREDDLRRRLQHGRRGAGFRRARRHRPDGDAGPDQSRFRRHPRGDDRDGQGDDGHRRGRGRRTAPSARPRRRSPTRCSTMSR